MLKIFRYVLIVTILVISNAKVNASNSAKLLFFKDFHIKKRGVLLNWQINNHDIKIPQGKFLRITVSYILNKQKHELIKTVPSNKVNLNLSININSTKGNSPQLYLSINDPIFYRKVQLATVFGLQECNKLTLYAKKFQNIAVNKEYVFATTQKSDGYKLLSDKLVFNYPNKQDKLLPKVDFKIKFTLTNISQSFSQSRNLSDKLHGLTLEKQMRYLEKKRNLYFKDFRVGTCPLGDLNIIQSYLIITNLKLKIAKISTTKDSDKLVLLKQHLAEEIVTLSKLQN